jgi:flagellin-like hook-associated protein FlgL
MVVQHNMQAANANRMLNVTTGQQAKSTEKLSSGYRINRAADDAAGLTISEKMRKQIKGLDRASTNAEDGVSAVQTAEGALTEVHSMLQRMNELATQASNGTNSESDRSAIQDEIDQLTTEIDRVAETTKFNETYLLKGDENGTKTETLNAHDAGIKGKLTDNGDTATFEIELKKGNTVSIAGKDYTIADATNEDKNELSADGAASKIKDALKAANDIGATASEASVTSSVQKQVVKAMDDPDAKFTAKSDMVAFDATNKTFKTISAGDDISAYVHDNNFKLYKGGSTTANLATGDKAKTGLLVVHEDAASSGVDRVINKDAVVTVAGGIKTVTGGVATADTNYKIYEEINLVADTTTDAAHEAYAKLQDDATTNTSFDIKFEGLGTDTATAEKKAEGQNALKTELSNIKYTFDGTKGAFSHNFGADSKLDIDHNGVVSYDGTKIATITASAQAGQTQAAGTAAIALNGDFVNAESVTKDGSDKYTFTITKGTTASAKDLSFNLHVGADADMTNKINVNIEAMNTENLGLKGLNVKDDSGIAATYAIDAIADAISKVSEQRSSLGAVQNRLEHTISNVDNVVENTTSAESRIRDTDMASEMVNYSKNNILAQAGQSMLAQANQSNQGVLSLLQ